MTVSGLHVQSNAFLVHGSYPFFISPYRQDFSHADEIVRARQLDEAARHRARLWERFETSYLRKNFGDVIRGSTLADDHLLIDSGATLSMLSNPGLHAVVAPVLRAFSEDDGLPNFFYRFGALVRRSDGESFTAVNLIDEANPYDRKNLAYHDDGTPDYSRSPLRQKIIEQLAMGVFLAREQGIPVTAAGVVHLSCDKVYLPRLNDPMNILEWISIWDEQADGDQEVLPRHHEEISALISDRDARIDDIQYRRRSFQKDLEAKAGNGELGSSEVESIYDISRLYKCDARTKLYKKLVEEGITDLRDIPDDFIQRNPGLSFSGEQQRQIQALKLGTVVVGNKEVLQQVLADIMALMDHPNAVVSSFDVETMALEYPLIGGAKLGDVMVPQFSLHRSGRGDAIFNSTEFLWEGAPQDDHALRSMDVAYAKAATEGLGQHGPILGWNTNFEKGRNREVAQRLRTYGEHDLADRLLDQSFDLKLLKFAETVPDYQAGIVANYKSEKAFEDYLRDLEKRAKDRETDAQKQDWFVSQEVRRIMKDHERFVDLLQIFRDHIYHPDFKGSFSLKSVVAALFPEFSYTKFLEGITSGGIATAALKEYYDFSTTPERRIEIREQALEYCYHDTFVPIVLLKYLFEAADMAWPFPDKIFKRRPLPGTIGEPSVI